MALSKEQVFNFVKRPKEEEGGRLSRSTAYYLWYWENVYSKGRSWSWNWAAAFFSGAWAIYRGMYILLLYGVLMDFSALTLCGFSLKKFYLYYISKYIISVIMFLLFGLFGTRLYFWWMEKKINKGVTRVKPKMWPALTFIILVLIPRIALDFKFSEDTTIKKLRDIWHHHRTDS